MSAERGRDGPPRHAGTDGYPPAAVDAAAAGERAPARAAGRVTGIEGLRAIAASSILVYHVWIYSSPGGRVDAGYLGRFALPHLPAGVTLFFALSGYLLYRPVAASVLATGRVPNVRNYLRNRALRILPAYWVVLTAVAVGAAGGPAPAVPFGARAGPAREPAGPAGRQCAAGPELPVGVAGHRDRAGLVAGRRGGVLPEPAGVGSWPRPGACGGPAAPGPRCSPCSCPPRPCCWWAPPGKRPASGSSLGDAYPGSAIVARSFLAQADLFVPGMVLAVLHVLVREGRVRLPRHWAAAVWALLAADVLAVVLLSDRGVLWRWGVANPYQRLTALACVLLVALVVLPRPADRPPRLARALDWRPLFLCGLASYSLFLWHEPITRLLAAQGLTVGGAGGLVVNLGIVGLAAGVLAAATYRFVERPALARKAGRTGRQRDPGSTAPARVTIRGLGHLSGARPADDEVTGGQTRTEPSGGTSTTRPEVVSPGGVS